MKLRVVNTGPYPLRKTLAVTGGRWGYVFRNVSFAVILLFQSTGLWAAPQAAASDESLHILLIGVSEYRSLRNKDLDGPANDVLLLEQTLRRRFGRQITSLRILSNASAADNQPTSVNIEREFRRLAELVTAGDRVLISMSGHGSQQPDTAGEEQDGLDEIFLPSDVLGWNGEKGTVENAISDDVLGEWLTQIRRQGAAVFLLVDSCHSGTLSRGTSSVSRSIAPDDLGIPTVNGPSADAGVDEGFDAAEQSDLPGSLVCVYAAQPSQLAYEDRLPDSKGRYHGRLTWAFCQLLTSYSGVLSYERLSGLLDRHYLSHGWKAGQPLCEAEGTSLSREFLGQELASIQFLPAPVLEGQQWKLQAGQLDGLTVGSIVAALDRAGEIAGYLRVLQVEPVSSVLQPIAHEDVPEPSIEQLKASVESRLIVRQEPQFRLRVRVDIGEAGDGSARELQASIEQEVAAAAAEDGVPVELADQQARPDLILLATNDSAYVAVAEPDDVVIGSNGQPAQRPGSLWRKLERRQLPQQLASICKQKLLRKLAQPVAWMGESSGSGLALHIRTSTSDGGEEEIADRATVVSGKKVTLELTNSGSRSWDVSLLYLGSDWTIQPIFPRRVGVYNRLEPGSSFRTPRDLPEIKVTAESIGIEDFLLLAVESAGSIPVNYLHLAQEGLSRDQRMRSAGAFDGNSLDALLEDVSGGRGRSISVEQQRNYEIGIRTWIVSP